jgi:D-3-phosphoglycerate dehydrogenase
MARVLISDSLDESGLYVLRQAGIELDLRHGLAGPALQAAIHEADGVIIRSGTNITSQELDNPGRLRAIVRAGVGVDNIDVAAATRHGIVVMNTPGGNTTSAAEHTIGLLLALARHIPQSHGHMHEGKWERGRFVGTQLAGKTLGIIGLGRIGREVARRALGLDMRVMGFDPFLAPERAGQLGIESARGLDDLLPQVDFLSVHTPLTDETRSMIGAAQLAKLPQGARVINCARGGIIDEQALAEALSGGHLAGAALDVFSAEPPRENPLLGLPNVVTTPHIGASTVEAQESVAREAAQLMADFLARRVVQFAVNMTAVDRTEMEGLRFYIDLARRLGLLHAQMTRGAIQKAELHYRGDVANKSTRLITAAFAAGLLEKRLSQNVNIVNAELLARDRGIEIVEQNSTTKGDFSSLVQARLVTDKKTYVAAATLFGHQFLRLVQLGPFRLDAYLDGILLILTHRDLPGLIGHIGTILGRHRINIAQMTVGRDVPGGEAIAVLNLDSAPSEQALGEIRQHPSIASLSLVNLPPAGSMPPWFG